MPPPEYLYGQADDEKASVRILTATWNVGHTKPEELAPWIPTCGEGFDLIAVSIQESTPKKTWKDPALKKSRKGKGKKGAHASSSSVAQAAVSASIKDPSPSSGRAIDEDGEDGEAEDDDEDDESDEDEADKETMEEPAALAPVTSREQEKLERMRMAKEKRTRSNMPEAQEAAKSFMLSRGVSVPPGGASAAAAAGSSASSSSAAAAAAAGSSSAAIGAGAGPASPKARSGAGGLDSDLGAIHVTVSGSVESDGEDDGDGGGSTSPSRTSPSTLRSARAIKDTVRAASKVFGMILDHLGEGWAVVEHRLLWEIGLLVCVRRELAGSIRDLSSDEERTGGPFRNLPNKGGVAISLTIHDTRLCFVGSHLAAHQWNAGLRDQDVMEIVDGCRGCGSSAMPDVDLDVQHHHVFWMGDLNYRVDFPEAEAIRAELEKRPPTDQGDHDAQWAKVSGMIDKGEYSALLAADQLRRRIRDGIVFHGFLDAPCDSFPPTFKMVCRPGYEYKAARIPSYCDRVLYKSAPRLLRHLHLEKFDAFEDIKTSDHKPVAARFRLSCRTPARPELLGADAKAPRVILRFNRIRGEDLMATDLSGKSDPYVRFFSDPPSLMHLGKSGVQPRTPRRSQTLTPEWEGDEIPDIVLNTTNPAQLARCHLFLVVMDWDRFDKDDRMGQAVLPLADVVRACHPSAGTTTFSFELPVTWCTSLKGTLSGELQVHWPSAGAVTARAGHGENSCCSVA